MHSDSPIIEPRLKTLSRKSFWQGHVDQWKTSDLSKKEYCRQHALVYQQMVYWSSKEKKLVADQPEKNSGFVAVTVAAVDSDQGLSIRLPNGLMIEGINSRSITLVGRLLEHL